MVASVLAHSVKLRRLRHKIVLPRRSQGNSEAIARKRKRPEGQSGPPGLQEKFSSPKILSLEETTYNAQSALSAIIQTILGM